MASLVSPGVSVTIVDESFYIPAAAPTVPLFFIATQSNKLQPNGVSPAEGTHEFGMIRTITSIGQSVSLYGIPAFMKDSSGAAFHGDARNEYGLFALNQYLGIGSYAYVIRANIDLADKPETYVSLGIPKVLKYDFVGVGGDVPDPANPGRFKGKLTGFQLVNPLPTAESELTRPETYTVVITQAAVFAAGLLASEAEYTVTGSRSGIIGTGVINGAFGAGNFDSTVIDLKVQLDRSGGPSTFQEYLPGDYFTFELEYTPTRNVANSSPLAGVFTSVKPEDGYELTLGTTETFTITIDPAATGFTVISSNPGAHPSDAGVIGSPFGSSGLGIEFTLSNGSIGSGLPNLVAGDSFTITAKGVMRANPLGANDEAKRKTITMALAQQITSNTEARSTDVFEYNLILCPGYHEIVTQLAALSQDIGEEAFVIADTPANKTPEQIGSFWATSSERYRAPTEARNTGYYYPWGIARNLDGAEVFVAPSGIAARAFAYNDDVAYPWFAPAGARRGVVTGINRLGYISGELGGATVFIECNLNQGQRDILYKNPANINPIVNFPAQGMVIWGQKTSQTTFSALDRINVVRLCMYLKRALRKGAFPFVFEPNDQITRDNLKAAIDGLLNDVMSKRGLYDFVTISDDSNNTPYRIDNNELWVDIAIKPVKAAEFIYIPIRVLSTGATMPG